jgi:hypothetical protein
MSLNTGPYFNGLIRLTICPKHGTIEAEIRLFLDFSIFEYKRKMTKKTKPTRDSKATPSESETHKRADDWSTDQETNRYYYDDSHGYEVYREEDDEPESDDSESQN